LKNKIYGKNVIITGTSSGIGLEIAKILAAEYSCRIFGSGRNLEKLERSKQIIDDAITIRFQKLSKKKQQAFNKGSYVFHRVDVSSEQDVLAYKKTLEEMGVVPDIIINNAGIILPFKRAELLSVQDIKKVIKTNYFSQLYFYKTFLCDLKLVRGVLVNMCSSSALCPIVGQAAYSASKGAIKNFTETIRVEHKKDFKVILICPGFAKTDLFREQKMSSLVNKLSMKSEKMARKVVRAISKGKRRAVIGADAHLMNMLYKLFPRSAAQTISSAISVFHDETFDNVFKDNKRDKSRD